MSLLAYIPSPHSGVVDLGPFHLHAYGITLLVAIAACIWLTGRRWVRMGGDWDLVLRAAVWGVAAGIVGARAYHDVTSWNEVPIAAHPNPAPAGEPDARGDRDQQRDPVGVQVEGAEVDDAAVR